MVGTNDQFFKRQIFWRNEKEARKRLNCDPVFPYAMLFYRQDWTMAFVAKDKGPGTEPMATDNGIFFAGISNQGNPGGLRSFRNGLNRFWSALIGCHPSSGCKPTREKTGYLSKARNAGFFSLGRKAHFFYAAGSCCVFSALVTSLQG
ncbi:hypothetical protein SUBVAR_05654 [Subdoligranulum variabile DSM 15176]|uniref:Uncharacterized protein n=1 Tax=Subdoligranulum variabile DSM 15176 TaxID=411471 RepID=D1PMU0_9FIRM|nr:hypothetical protein SUBVAR_05654 [Subdoligranulum variabile DSM 15176]